MTDLLHRLNAPGSYAGQPFDKGPLSIEPSLLDQLNAPEPTPLDGDLGGFVEDILPQPQDQGLLSRVGEGIVSGAKEFIPGTIGLAATAATGVAQLQQAAGTFSAKTARAQVERIKSEVPNMSDEEYTAFREKLSLSPLLGPSYQRFSDFIRSGADVSTITPEQETAVRHLARSVQPPTLRVEDRPAFALGEALGGVAEELSGIEPGQEPTVPQMLGQGLGSMFAGIIAIVATGGAGGAALFATAGAGEAAERARAENATPEQEQIVAVMGLVPGLTDTLPVELLLRRIPKATRGRFVSYLKRLATMMIAEGGQEAGQQFMQNWINREVVDPGQDLGEGIAGAGGIGAGVGGIAETFFSMIPGARRARRGPVTEQPTPPPPAPPTAAVQPTPADQEAVREAVDRLQPAPAPPAVPPEGPRPTAGGPVLDVGTVEDIEASPLPTDLIAAGQAAIVTPPVAREAPPAPPATTTAPVAPEPEPEAVESATQRRLRIKREKAKARREAKKQEIEEFGPPPPKAPPNILEFLAEEGGIKDEGGELNVMDAHLWHRGRAFQKKLVREDGRSPDAAKELAEEAGYLQPGSTLVDFYAAIDNNLRGEPVFAAADLTEVAELQEAETAENERARYEGMTDDEIATELGLDPVRSTQIAQNTQEDVEQAVIQAENDYRDEVDPDGADIPELGFEPAERVAPEVGTGRAREAELAREDEAELRGRREEGEAGAPVVEGAPSVAPEPVEAPERPTVVPSVERPSDALTELGFTRLTTPDNVYALSQPREDGRTDLYNVRVFGDPPKYRVTMSSTFEGGITGTPSRDIGTFDSMEEAAVVVRGRIESVAAVPAVAEPPAVVETAPAVPTESTTQRRIREKREAVEEPALLPEAVTPEPAEPPARRQAQQPDSFIGGIFDTEAQKQGDLVELAQKKPVEVFEPPPLGDRSIDEMNDNLKKLEAKVLRLERRLEKAERFGFDPARSRDPDYAKGGQLAEQGIITLRSDVKAAKGNVSIEKQLIKRLEQTQRAGLSTTLTAGIDPIEAARSIPRLAKMVREDIARPEPKLTPAQQAAVERLVPAAAKKTLRQRLDDAGATVKALDARKHRQGFLDQFDSLRHYEVENYGKVDDARTGAWKAALLTQNLQSVMAVAMRHGPITYNPKDGMFQVVEKQKGFEEIFNPLTKHKEGNLINAWKAWAIGQRSKRLTEEGRESFVRPSEIEAILPLGGYRNLKTGAQEIEARYPEFQKVMDEWIAFNKMHLDMAEEVGVINAEQRALWEKSDYVPFFRIIDDATKSPYSKRGLSGQRSGIRKLKGGEAPLGDILENMVMNTSHLIDASFKTIAMQRSIELGLSADVVEPAGRKFRPVGVPITNARKALLDNGIDVRKLSADERQQWMTLFSMVPPTESDIVSVMVDGKPEYYRVLDPLLHRSLTSLNSAELGGIMTLFRLAKKTLTIGVTTDPAFMVANLLRDTLSSWVVVGENKTPGFGTAKGLLKSLREDKSLIAIMAAGGGSGGFYRTAPEDVRKLIGSRLKGINTRTLIDTPKKAWELWQKIGNASENANRIAIHDAVLKRGGSKADAVAQAQDLLNFTMRGDYAAMRMLIDMIPFMNARVQGLYRMARGAKANPTRFLMRGIMITTATMALYAANRDNDDYKALADWDKDTYYHFYIGGDHYRLPKPFEIGAIFSTVPERLALLYDGTDDGKRFGGRIFAMFMETFALNPLPQLVKPIAEIWANKNTFTQRPIIGLGLQGVSPEAQYNSNTSDTAILAGRALPDLPGGLNAPINLEFAVRGYFGALGSYVLAVSDMFARQFTGRGVPPARRLDQIPVVQRFVRDNPAFSTRWLSDFYETKREADKLFRTFNEYHRRFDPDRAQALAAANQPLLRARPTLNKHYTAFNKINRAMRQVRDSKTMSAKAKRRELDKLMRLRNERAKQLRILLRVL